MTDPKLSHLLGDLDAFARERNAKLDAIVLKAVDEDLTPQQIFDRLAEIDPETTMAEVEASFRRVHATLTERIQENTAEAERMDDVVGLLTAYGFTDDAKIGDSLRALAARGVAGAAELAKEFEPDPLFHELMDLAVAEDPTWEKTERGWSPLPGATHKTPEDLLRAYVETHQEARDRLAQQWLTNRITEELEERVARGEMTKEIGEDGEPYYLPTKPDPAAEPPQA